jgi:hypothetical protein
MNDRYLDPPEPAFAMCECGHDEDQHNEPEDLEQSELLEAMQAIDGFASNHNDERTVPQIRSILDKYLAVCAECECRRFVESDEDPDDDGDSAFDTARDDAMERNLK